MKSFTLLICVSVAFVAGCASPRHRAPVEDRTAATRPAAPPVAPVETQAAPPAPEVTSPRPGTYTVKPGDTLIRIGLETGQNWRDIARWSGIENPNTIEVGQVLRIAAPTPEPGSAVAQPVPTARTETRPLPPAASAPASTTPTPTTTPTTTATPAPPASPTPAPATGADEDLNWLWPASGPVLAVFDEARNKGVAIGGKAGDPVLAAADGRVVYAGSGLRGYGNLVIVKHNNTFLTAYAHNQTLLVKEDQAVRRGQRIAEMGNSDADRVQLHFEIRRQGKPVDPARYLPAR